MSERVDRAPGRPSDLSPRSKRLLWSAFLAVMLSAVVAMIPLPYAVLRPGPATNTLGTGSDGKPLIEVEGAPTYPTTGGLDFTTVRVSGGPGRRVNAWDLIGAWLNPHDEIFPEEQLFPAGSTSQEVKERNTAEMVGSQQEATAVALRSLGKTVGQRYVVGSVDDAAPAAAQIEPGDTIVSIDGTTVDSLEHIQQLVRAHKAGEQVTLVVQRDGASRTLTPKTTSADGRTVLGVRLQAAYDFPFEVTIHAGDVGGPSAGSMFALAIRDVLTPGAMTGGKQIAGTGTIDDAGHVGPIGGIRQKVVGANEAGARYFLTPADNCAELKGEVPDEITPVRIATFDDAVKAVEMIAAERGPLPQC